MKKNKLFKRATSPFYTEINNTNPNIYKKIQEINNDSNFKNLLKNFFIATSEFYKISKNNSQQMIKLLSILEKSNNDNYINQNFNSENYSAGKDSKQNNSIINDLKLIISTNINNLSNYYYDSKIILKNLELDRKNEKQKMIRSMSDNKKPLIIDNYNKTIDNINHKQLNSNDLSPVRSFALKKQDNTNIKENVTINSLLSKLINFNDIIGAYSPEMKTIYMKINYDLYNEFKNLEKENQKNKIDLGIKNTRISSKNKNRREANSFSMTGTNFYDRRNRNDSQKIIKTLNIYKIKNENYELKIDELKCQLEDLKSYSNALEKTLEDKNINNKNSNNNQNNEQDIYKINNLLLRNKNMIKSLENLNESNKKLTEENNQINLVLKKNELIIKKLSLNNNNLKIKLKEYENIITQNELENLNIKSQNNTLENENNKNKFNSLQIIHNNFFSFESYINEDSNSNKNKYFENLEETIKKKDNEILSLKNQLNSCNNNIKSKELEISSLNKKLKENFQSNNNYKSLLNDKDKEIYNQKKDLEDLNNQINNLKNEIKNNELNLKNKYKKYIIKNEINIEIIGKQEQIEEKENEYKIKYEQLNLDLKQKNKELNSIKQDFINKINILNSTITDNNHIIEKKDIIIKELKLNQDKDISNKNSINNFDLMKKELEDEIIKLKKDNENILKANNEIKQSIIIKDKENKENNDIIRELKEDKLLLESELDDYKKKNQELKKEIIESRNQFNNASVRSNNSLKESYNKKVSKTHTELTKKIKTLEDEVEHKDIELDGLRNFIEKLQKEKEDIVLNNNGNINSNENEEKLKREIEKLKSQLEHLSSTFPKEMEELRKENQNLLNKYNNLKREKNNSAPQDNPLSQRNTLKSNVNDKNNN